MGTTAPLLLGNLDPETAYITNGPLVQALGVTSAEVRITDYDGPFSDNLGGCLHNDELAVFSRDDIALWHPTRPTQYIGPWREDGCPPDISGSFKSLISVNGWLIAYWEMDNAAPVPTAGRGNTLIFWGRPNQANQWTWHVRSAKKSDGTDTDPVGGFPLSCGQAMVMAEASVSGGGARRLVVPTADGTTGGLYYQAHPLPGSN